MKFTIKSRFNDSIVLEVEADSFLRAVEKGSAEGAHLEGANLGNAYLEGAHLEGAHLRGANLRNAYLRNAYLRGAYLRNANLEGANLGNAHLRGAYLGDADLTGADLTGAYLRNAYLGNAYLEGAHLEGANLEGANLEGAYLEGANLRNANLRNAYLRGAYLRGAYLEGAKNLVKVLGVEPGNYYWKRFEEGLKNNSYQFYVGLNTLRDGEVFAGDECVTCSYPGFHFASRSWCDTHYGNRPLEAKIRIPEDAQINEPWATDGKASADKIEIIQVFDVTTGEDVTDKYRREI